MTSSGLIVRPIELGPMMNYIYIIGCGQTRSAGVVDPAWDVPEILRILREQDLRLEHVLLTHAHPDHVNGLEPLLESTGARVYVHEDEIRFMREMSVFFQIPITFLDKHAGRFQPVTNGRVLQIGDIAVQVIHTPGHSPGSQCFLAEKHLFSGDTLFVDACGRVDLPGGDAAKMWNSLNRLRALDDDVVIYPGHSYGDRQSSTIGEQKITNPYMQFASAEDFARAMAMD